MPKTATPKPGDWDEPAPLMLGDTRVVTIGQRRCIEYTSADGFRVVKPIDGLDAFGQPPARRRSPG